MPLRVRGPVEAERDQLQLLRQPSGPLEGAQLPRRVGGVLLEGPLHQDVRGQGYEGLSGRPDVKPIVKQDGTALSELMSFNYSYFIFS